MAFSLEKVHESLFHVSLIYADTHTGLLQGVFFCCWEGGPGPGGKGQGEVRVERYSCMGIVHVRNWNITLLQCMLHK